jgi:hypothetical protein
VSITTERGWGVAQAQVANRITNHISLDGATTKSAAIHQAELEQATLKTEQNSPSSYRSFGSEWVQQRIEYGYKTADRQ